MLGGPDWRCAICLCDAFEATPQTHSMCDACARQRQRIGACPVCDRPRYNIRPMTGGGGSVLPSVPVCVTCDVETATAIGANIGTLLHPHDPARWRHIRAYLPEGFQLTATLTQWRRLRGVIGLWTSHAMLRESTAISHPLPVGVTCHRHLQPSVLGIALPDADERVLTRRQGRWVRSRMVGWRETAKPPPCGWLAYKWGATLEEIDAEFYRNVGEPIHHRFAPRARGVPGLAPSRKSSCASVGDD